MAREVSTTEALMTDPTTPEGAAYWQERRNYEAALERLTCPSCLSLVEDGDGVRVGDEFFHLECWEDASQGPDICAEDTGRVDDIGPIACPNHLPCPDHPALCDCAGEAKWWLGEHRPAKRGLDGRPACPAWTPA